MSIYWYRRIMVIIAVILATITVIKTVSFIGDFINEDFACKEQVKITAVSGDTVSELVSDQVQKGNCTGYEPLLHYTTDKFGTDLQPGDEITIPQHK